MNFFQSDLWYSPDRQTDRRKVTHKMVTFSDPDPWQGVNVIALVCLSHSSVDPIQSLSPKQVNQETYIVKEKLYFSIWPVSEWDLNLENISLIFAHLSSIAFFLELLFLN